MHVLNSSGSFTFHNRLDIKDKLPNGNYELVADPIKGLSLSQISDFKLPAKIYDINKDMRDIVVKAFKGHSQNMGVLLTGEKGFGKTIDAKLITKHLNIPVIVISEPIPREFNFTTFLSDISQDFILFIDEFDKIFLEKSEDYHTQESFLSFMDGSRTNSNSKILFLFTTNIKVNEYLNNRPSRIKFLKHYQEMSDELIDMIIEDLLVNKEYKEDLLNNIYKKYLNLDTLISIIKDVNLLDVPYSKFCDIYNHKKANFTYRISIYKYKKTKTPEPLLMNKVTMKDFKLSYHTVVTRDKLINLRTTTQVESLYLTSVYSTQGDTVIYNSIYSDEFYRVKTTAISDQSYINVGIDND